MKLESYNGKRAAVRWKLSVWYCVRERQMMQRICLLMLVCLEACYPAGFPDSLEAERDYFENRYLVLKRRNFRLAKVLCSITARGFYRSHWLCDSTTVIMRGRYVFEIGHLPASDSARRLCTEAVSALIEAALPSLNSTKVVKLMFWLQ